MVTNNFRRIRDIIYGKNENYTWFYNINNSNLIFSDIHAYDDAPYLYDKLTSIGFNNKIIIPQKNYETFTICINISNTCNFKCRYCFAHHPFNKISFEDACKFIEEQINLHSESSKYIVDLSGSGEPLLFLDEILKIKEFCLQLSNRIEKEILVMFVTNGYLLTSKIAKLIQEHGILFGVSIDGNKDIHNKNRLLYDGSHTYDIIYNNLLSIENKTYVGIAISLEFGKYDLYEFFELFKDFNTISIKPLRNVGNQIFTNKIVEMNDSYDLLTESLIHDIDNGKLINLKKILNGDDYFGRFICRLIHHDIILERCDAKINRISIKDKTHRYICTSAIFDDHYLYNEYVKPNLDLCNNCVIKYICGGECQLMIRDNNPDIAMCNFKFNLFCNAVKIYHKLYISKLFDEVYKFIEEKNNRYKLNKELYKLVEKYKGIYTFNEIKDIFDGNKNIEI